MSSLVRDPDTEVGVPCLAVLPISHLLVIPRGAPQLLLFPEEACPQQRLPQLTHGVPGLLKLHVSRVRLRLHLPHCRYTKSQGPQSCVGGTKGFGPMAA